MENKTVLIPPVPVPLLVEVEEPSRPLMVIKHDTRNPESDSADIMTAVDMINEYPRFAFALRFSKFTRLEMIVGEVSLVIQRDLSG